MAPNSGPSSANFSPLYPKDGRSVFCYLRVASNINVHATADDAIGVNQVFFRHHFTTSLHENDSFGSVIEIGTINSRQDRNA